MISHRNAMGDPLEVAFPDLGPWIADKSTCGTPQEWFFATFRRVTGTTTNNKVRGEVWRVHTLHSALSVWRSLSLNDQRRAVNVFFSRGNPAWKDVPASAHSEIKRRPSK